MLGTKRIWSGWLWIAVLFGVALVAWSQTWVDEDVERIKLEQKRSHRLNEERWGPLPKK